MPAQPATQHPLQLLPVGYTGLVAELSVSVRSATAAIRIWWACGTCGCEGGCGGSLEVGADAHALLPALSAAPARSAQPLQSRFKNTAAPHTWSRQKQKAGGLRKGSAQARAWTAQSAASSTAVRCAGRTFPQRSTETRSAAFRPCSWPAMQCSQTSVHRGQAEYCAQYQDCLLITDHRGPDILSHVPNNHRPGTK